MQFRNNISSYCVLIFICQYYCSYTQPASNTASQFNQISDIKKAEQLNKTSWKYYLQKKDSALFTAKKALVFAKEYGEKETVFIANIQLAEIYRQNTQLLEAKYYLDKAKLQLYAISSSIQKGRYYLYQGKLAYSNKDYTIAQEQLSIGYNLQYNHDQSILIDICIYLSKVAEKEKKHIKAEHYLKETLTLLEGTTTYSKSIRILNNLGNLKARQQQYAKAKEYYKQSLQLADTHQDTIGQSRAHLNIGNIFYYKGDWASAISFYLKSIVLKEALGDEKGIAKTHNNIAAIYKQQKRYQESLRYYKKSELYFKSKQDSVKLAETWINSAIVTIFLKEPQKALSMLDDALSVLERYDLPKTQLIAESNMAFANYEMRNYKEALHYLTKAEKKATILNKKYSIVFITNLYGACYFKLKKYPKAIEYYKQSYELSKKMELFTEQKKALFGLYETEQSLNNFEQSLKWHEKYTQIKDSLFNTESNTKLVELQEKYEAKQKEQDIYNLNVANKKVALKNTIKSNQLRLSLLGTLLAVLATIIIGLLLYYRNKTQKAILIHTEEKNKEQVNQLIQQQEITTLETVLLTQQQERKKLAKDIHDNLGSYLATLKYQYEASRLIGANKSEKKQLKLMAQLIADAYAEVRSISHRMATGEGFEFNLLNAINKITDRIQKTNQFTVQFHDLTKELELPQDTELTLYKIIQELLSNILKHAQATEITIQINEDQEGLTLVVEDNGKGFDTTITNKGIGLTNISEHVTQLEGQLDINSRIGYGTTTVILVPILKAICV